MKKQVYYKLTMYIGILILLIFFTFLPDLSASKPYSIIELGKADWEESKASAINDTGYIVGWYRIGKERKPFLREPSGNIHRIPLAGDDASASGINADGNISGYSFSENKHQAFMFDGKKINYITARNKTAEGGSAALGINNNNQVVGYCFTKGSYHAFIWDKNAGTRDLHSEIGGTSSAACSINNKGAVVGYLLQGGVYNSFLWEEEKTPIAIDDLLWGLSSVAMSINDSGTITGYAFSHESYKPFIYNPANGAKLIPTLGGKEGYAYDINNKGTVVGRSKLRDGTFHAFMWSNGNAVDLNDLIPEGSQWVLEEARAINEHGEIVGYGVFMGRKSAFLLSTDSGRDTNNKTLAALLIATLTAATAGALYKRRNGA